MEDREKLMSEMNRCELLAEIMHLQDEVERLKNNITDMSWELNIDRMGGQFTVEELNRPSRL